MHDKEYNDLLKSMKSFIKRLKKNDRGAKKLAKQFLVNAGITTEKGNLRHPYRGETGYTVTNRKNAKLRKNRK